MISYPLNPRIKKMSAQIEFDSVLNTARSGRRQSVAMGPSRLVLTLDYNSSREGELEPLMAFLNSLQGHRTVFEFPVPDQFSGTGVAVAGATVQSAVASGYQVSVQGLPAAAVVRKAGNLIQFSGSARVYMLAADLVSNAAGEATVVLCSPLLSPLSAGNGVVLNNIVMRSRWMGKAMPMQFAAANFRSLKQVKIEEEISA